MKSNEQTAMAVSMQTIIANIVLTGFKLAAGIIAHSGAMVSDAVHSASDVFSTMIVMAGVKMANKESDREHPYGHERLECVAAIILAVVLGATGIGIGYAGIQKITAGPVDGLMAPGKLALVAAVLSVVTKEIMYRYTRSAAKKINSGALMADAWHHRTDALSSIGSLLGIWGARLGFPILDPIAGAIISLFILKAAYDIFKDAVSKMMDTACSAEQEEKIRSLILAQDGVLGIDQLKTRLFGDRMYVDCEISVDNRASLVESHQVAQVVHDMLETALPEIKHCMVHVNPSEDVPSDAEGMEG